MLFIFNNKIHKYLIILAISFLYVGKYMTESLQNEKER